MSQSPPQSPPVQMPPVATSDLKVGLAAAITAYGLWGFLPLYFKLVGDVSSLEVLAHRILWSIPFGAAIISMRHQWPEIKKALSQKDVLGWLAFSAIVIALNWLIYIWAVQNNFIFQASLGYYINPFFYMLAGVLLTGETLNRLQLGAIVLAVTGVLILTIYGGEFPILGLTLAITFTAYGLIRRKVNIGAMPGQFLETLWLFPFGMGYLVWLTTQADMAFSPTTPGLMLLLILAGPVTVVPLVLFATATKKLKLSTIGFLQFIGPTIQFMIGLIYGEDFTPAHAACFICIWSAVGLFCLNAWQQSRPTSRSITSQGVPR